MARIRWTNEAEKWLRDIHDYIAQDNPIAAQRVISAIYEKAQILKDFPEIGYKYRTEPEGEIRIWSLSNCLSHKRQGFDRYFRDISWCDGNRQIFKIKFWHNNRIHADTQSRVAFFIGVALYKKSHLPSSHWLWVQAMLTL